MQTTASSLMLASQRWHTENHFRLMVSHRSMPSLCPLPSAVNTGGQAVLLPWEVSFEEEEPSCSFDHSRTWVQSRFLVPKLQSWHLGIPGARLHHSLVLPARAWECVGGVRVQGPSVVPRCPTGNDTQVVSLQSQTLHSLIVRGDEVVVSDTAFSAFMLPHC